MLSYSSPASMPGAPHPHEAWASLLHPPVVKSEPVEAPDAYPKDQMTSFCSEGFHSASPSSSSKDSNGHSPSSVGSAGDQATLYDLPLHAKANLGSRLDTFDNGMPYNILSPDCYKQNDRSSPSYKPYSPSKPNTPGARASPPKSPSTPVSMDESSRRSFHDSGVDHMQGAKEGDNGSGMEDYDDEPGIRVPAVNSHGKIKTFKCKQCQFVAVTKLSFWEHSAIHMKPEKILRCTECPFLTEFKHHLEYHMRNHFGKKPFQCSQCSYSCVNKSMLNSHLKSHSNVYQYRCADCNYASKYCHSLKLHLRKYKHSPDIVLNVDGTENPLPIIDVYGTRRGPKQKPISKFLEEQATISSQPRPPHSFFGNHLPVNFPYLPPLLQHSFLFPPNNNYEPMIPANTSEAMEKLQAMTPNTILQQRLSYSESTPKSRVASPVRSPPSPPRTPPATPSAVANDALDLTNTKPEASQPPMERPASLTPTTASKNRRKGRAFKLQPAALKLQHVDEKMRDVDSGSDSDASADSPMAKSNTFACQYCDITFGDLTMHTIHMGFHGYNDPFMCNKCGERSPDKVAFFIHLGRAQHA